MTDKIECPNCGHPFDVEEVLSSKLEEQLREKYAKRVADEANRLNAEKAKLQEEKNRLEKAKDLQEEQLKELLEARLKTERLKLEDEVSESMKEELAALKNENEKRKQENQSLKRKEVELLQKEAQLKEQQEDMDIQLQKKLLEEKTEIEEKARLKEREAFELEKIKLLKQIEDNRKLAEEMKRKAEQGSMQLQGEVQELALENTLGSLYPFDIIEPVPKGVRGADCVQKVRNSQQQVCGSIVYESKRTKAFANDWLEKLKNDQLTCKADIAVIATETMPSDMDRFGQKDGVWICGFHEIAAVSSVLREILLQTNAVRSSQENKSDKMELLYNYLTSTEFVNTVTRIVENYDAMITQLNSEKKAMHKIWAAREKQIWVVQQNVSALFGSIKGIAGASLETSAVLELPNPEFQ